MAEIDVPVTGTRHAAASSDFSGIEIEAEDRLTAPAFTKVKSEQAQPAAPVQDWLARTPKKIVWGGKNRVAAEFAHYVTAEPELLELGGHAGTRRLVFAAIVSPVFHLLRIIALATLIHGRLFFRISSRRFFRRDVRRSRRGPPSLQQVIRAVQGNGARRIRTQTRPGRLHPPHPGRHLHRL